MHASESPVVCEGMPLGDWEFEQLRRLVYLHAGINLGPQKREMLKARLTRRVRILGLRSFAEYCRFLQDAEAAREELVPFVNSVTTNVTEFFRERHHFVYLAEKWLPAVRVGAAQDGNRRLRLWSAGCSTGEEPYSIAMMLRETLGLALPSWDVRILASDIDTDVLQRAEDGIFPQERTAEIAPELLKRSFLRGTRGLRGLVRVRSEVKRLIAFRRINLMADPWPIHTSFDVIFCRNVLIYFGRDDQRRLLERLLALLKPDGLLLLGHSEGLHGWFHGMKHVQSTIYQRAAEDRSSSALP